MSACGKRMAKPREAGLPSPVAKKPRPAPAGAKVERKVASPTAGRRKPNDGSPQDVENEVEDAGGQSGANHNKYCHFCQHVKVRASSMLACENQECSRRFCEHCLLTHLGEDVDPMSSDAWTMVDGKASWSCPICRSKCCCSVTECTATHRHCKAYRYRRRRAELALKRVAAISDKRTGKKPTTKRLPANVTERDSANNVADELEVAETPPATATTTWVEEMNVQHGHEGCASPIESVVGSPRSPHKARRAEEYHNQERLMQGIWSHSAGGCDDVAGAPALGAGMPLLLHVHEDDASASQQHAKAERHMEDCDDMLASVLGHMSEVTDLEEISSDVSVADLGWSGQGCSSPLPTLDALLDEAEFRAQQPESKEVDEVEWLRRTYETVYNPTARQRSLDQLLAASSTSKRPAFKPVPAVRSTKSTILYDFV